MSINVGYFVRESVTNFRRNWIMSVGAVITIYLSLLLVGIFFQTGLVVNNIVEDVENKVTIRVFLKDGAATEDVSALQKELLADPMVAGGDADGERGHVEYVSKEAALEAFKEQMKNSPEIVAQLDGNPLPASLDVTLKNPRDVRAMVAKIKKSELFLKVADRPDNPEESLKYGQQIVDRLFAFTRVVRVIEIVLLAMLGVVSLIFMNNTIRLAIYARRKEIGIMRLVGASNWFIRAPFLLEGVLQALIGAGLAIASIAALQALVQPKLREVLSFVGDAFSGVATLQISLILVFAGVLIGVAGSWLAMTRYLKV